LVDHNSHNALRTNASSGLDSHNASWTYVSKYSNGEYALSNFLDALWEFKPELRLQCTVGIVINWTGSIYNRCFHKECANSSVHFHSLQSKHTQEHNIIHNCYSTMSKIKQLDFISHR